MERFAVLLLTSLGFACLFAGYKLFCGLPALNGETSRASRTGVLLLNIIPGILLALIGAGVLTAQVEGILSHRNRLVERHQSPDDTSWHLHNRAPVSRDRAA